MPLTFPRLEFEKNRVLLASRFPTRPAVFVSYLIVLSLVGWHLAHNFSYSMDMLGYMGNVALIKGLDLVKAHDEVYHEVRENIPAGSRAHLLGIDKESPPAQIESRRDRSLNPYHAAEYFPCYAIRPLYIEAVSLVNRTGPGLVRSVVLVSVLSYLVIAALVFLWSVRDVSPC